jgi:hypothetical protein
MLPILLPVLGLIAQQPAAPAFVVRPAEGSPLTGQLEKLTDGWAVTVKTDDGKTIDLPAGELIELRRSDRRPPPWPAGPGLILTGGDRIAGTVTGGDGRTVRFTPEYARREKGADWPVPIASVAALWVTAPEPRTPTNPADYTWAAGPGRRDVLLLRNGDVIRGSLEAFTSGPAGVRIKVGSERTTLPLTRIAAVSFDPALARDRRPKGTHARVVVADGSRIMLAEARADGQTLHGKTPYGVAVELPLSDLISLHIIQGKAVYLSDLKPQKASIEAYNGLAWPWTADRTVKGNPLRIGDQTFDKGLGTHARTTLAYHLDGQYRRFETQVGLDPVTGRRGAVDLRVLVDGRELPIPGLAGLTIGGSPKTITVPVTGAKELTLVVDFGPAGDVQDDVNWGDARLIR